MTNANERPRKDIPPDRTRSRSGAHGAAEGSLPRLGNPNTRFGSAAFGTIRRAGDARQVQYGLRYDFQELSYRPMPGAMPVEKRRQAAVSSPPASGVSVNNRETWGTGIRSAYLSDGGDILVHPFGDGNVAAPFVPTPLFR